MRVLKLSFDPSMPGEAWHTDEQGKPRGGSFDGQWYVFEKYPDGTRSKPLFSASTSNACYQWIMCNTATPPRRNPAGNSHARGRHAPWTWAQAIGGQLHG